MTTETSEPHSWDFTRIDEISAYAREHDLSIKAAIIQLVNTALSGDYRQGYRDGFADAKAAGEQEL